MPFFPIFKKKKKVKSTEHVFHEPFFFFWFHSFFRTWNTLFTRGIPWLVCQALNTLCARGKGGVGGGGMEVKFPFGVPPVISHPIANPSGDTRPRLLINETSPRTYPRAFSWPYTFNTSLELQLYCCIRLFTAYCIERFSKSHWNTFQGFYEDI